MKKVLLLVAMATVLFSCKKQKQEKLDEYEKNQARILTIEIPAGTYSHGYTMKGEGMAISANGQEYTQYAVSELFSNNSYQVGRNLAKEPLSPSDSIYFLRSVRE